MSMTLTEILDLTGKLDDTPGEDTPRARFRRHLAREMSEPGRIRDYVEECLRNTGDQYNRALQDLVNQMGTLMEFEVTPGRYQGTRNEIGFDGLWRSPSGFCIVAETKTTEVYAIKTTTLVGYIDELIAAGKITHWDEALGLYVVGRPDPELNQLANAIVGQKRNHQLRIISANSLLSLLELMQTYDVRHDDILTLLRPSGVTIDPVVDLLNRIVAGQPAEGLASNTGVHEAPAVRPTILPPETTPNFWLTPVASDSTRKAEETILDLVGREHIYAFGERTPGRTKLKPGDWICFYASGTGVIAHARVKTAPERMSHPKIRQPAKFTHLVKLEKVKLYPDTPIILNLELRSQLAAFQHRDQHKSWAWFVQGTHQVDQGDFAKLTGGHT
jgi:hypothetical protein